MAKLVQQQSAGGFTLVELLVSIGVLSTIAGIGISIFIALNSAYDRANVINTVNYEGTRLMEMISRSIRNAVEAEELVSGDGVRLTIPREDANLEYANNGRCTLVDIYYVSLDNTLRKVVDDATCSGTPVCPASSPCILTSDEVSVTDFTIDVTNNLDIPDAVRINLRLQQDPSLSDPEQRASQGFDKVVLTRGY